MISCTIANLKTSDYLLEPKELLLFDTAISWNFQKLLLGFSKNSINISNTRRFFGPIRVNLGCSKFLVFNRSI